MPFYEYKCRTCGHEGERLVVVASDRTCQRCDATIELIRELSSPFQVNIPREFVPYNDPVLGYVTSRRSRSRAIKENGLVEYGGEDTENIEKIARENRKREMKKRVDAFDPVLDRALTQAEQGVPTDQILREIADNA